MLKLLNANPETLEPVPNENKTQKISEKSVERELYVLKYVPDTQKYVLKSC